MNHFSITVGPNQARLTAYVQDRSPEMPYAAKRPAVLIFPGGAYRMCSDREAEPVALAYLRHGFNAFVLRYTVGDGLAQPDLFARAFADARAALAYLRENTEALDLLPGRIAVVGFSAGGNLAAAMGVLAEEKPDALILGYAVLDYLVKADLHVKAPNMIDLVNEKTPPTFLFTTHADPVVPSENTLLFALALARHGVPYETHTFLTGGHGLSLAQPFTGPADPDVAQWLALSVRFLRNLWVSETPKFP